MGIGGVGGVVRNADGHRVGAWVRRGDEGVGGGGEEVGDQNGQSWSVSGIRVRTRRR